MKTLIYLFITLLIVVAVIACNKKTMKQSTVSDASASAGVKYLFVDVHNLPPGKVKFADVAGAHQKDLATQKEFGVTFRKYWVDEAQGKVYCLSESRDSASVYATHKKAHGLVPDRVMLVTDGPEATIRSGTNLYMDVHHFGPGKVTDADVAAAHSKDLATQGKFNVNFINYWVDKEQGIVMCLANAPDSATMVRSHKEANGLIPSEVHLVKQGE